TYVLRAGAEGENQFPVRGVFRVVPFKVGARPPILPGFAAAAPSQIKLGAPREIARGAPCRPPVFLADGRVVVGSTIVDVSNGVTVQFSLPASEIAWSPVGDKLAYITTDRKELDLAGPDGS